MSTPSPEQNKNLCLQAFDTLFNRRDYQAAPAALRYENARIFAAGEYVMLHGRFTGNGQPRALVAADILRIADGVLAEHWDVLQNEVTREESRSGLPMFGNSFAEPDRRDSAGSVASALTVEEARTIVAPLYEALNEPARKDVTALLARATNPDYRSYSTNEDWLTRDQLADVVAMLGLAIPNLRWTIKDIRTCGDQIVVRGEATGTPERELFGAQPTGKSFKTMAVDLFTVRNGKLACAYHVENWVGALQQIGEPNP